ncbi:Ulp1 protease family, C-terminal catalytic domain [Sesbania bispinosa]|nr:Ulp1 protease family, C-terminal catalytic domain [Sesbania bispinosa]
MKFLKQINDELTTVQRDRLRATPFGCTLEVPHEMQISVGLCIVGKKVSFDETANSHTMCLFEGNQITIPDIVAKLRGVNGDEDLNIFCRLYILISFAEFYFPSTSTTVNVVSNVIVTHKVVGNGPLVYLAKRESKYRQQVAIEVGVTNDEVEEYSVLKEAMCEAECGFRNCQFRNMDLDEIRRENVALRESDKKQEERISYLEQEDLSTMKPRGWVSNMVFLLAPKLFMAHEMGSKGQLSRYMFKSRLVSRVIGELESFDTGEQKRWTSRSVRDLVDDSTSIHELRACSMVFAPGLLNHHWFCYAVDKEQEKMFVLDSVDEHSLQDQRRLDNAMKCRLGELLRILNPKSHNNSDNLAIEYVDLPRQHNGHDCGIYVLKYMETWDGVTKYGDKSMPNYSLQDIKDFRVDYVCQWVLHPLNEERQKVLMED